MPASSIMMRTRRSNGPRRKLAEVAAVFLGAAAVLGASGCESSGSHADGASTATTTPKATSAGPVRPVIVHPHDRAVPILNYHVVGAPPANAPFPELYVGRSDFVQQLAWLHRRGYTAVSLRRVVDYWRRGYALPPRPIVLSFDDGYRGDFTNALPLLRRYRWPGVLNLAVQNMLDGKLTLPELRSLIAAGWEIDAHTLTHPDLTTLDSAELRRQVGGSRRWIRRRLGVPVDFFCYPSGRYDAAVLAAVRAAGFIGATTTQQGYASPRDGLLTLDRIKVDGSDGLSGLVAKLRSFR
jgi:peptidoglycan/xylan/chitin deacetylase (PgdA/CDA1 family)